MSAREEIAAAASTVDGVECTPFYRGAGEVGAGYVEWSRSEWPNRFGAVDFWSVVIVVPSEPDAAEHWVEDHRQALYDGISEALIVTTISPSLVPITDGPSLKAVTVAGHREAD